MRSLFAYEPDLEIERTFHIRRKKQMLEKIRKAQEMSTRMDIAVRDQTKTLWDFITPKVQDISSSILRPIVEVNNFELRLVLVSMLQQI